MSGESKTKRITSELHELFVQLATACLEEEPDDVEMFCIHLLTIRQGLKVEITPELSHFRSHENDSQREKAKSKKSRREGRREKNASRIDEYTTEDSAARSEIYESDPFHSEGELDDSEGQYENVGRVQTVVADPEHQSPSCPLFSTTGISEEELEQKTELYRNDERMKRLFRAWDGDDSGRVDFVELVLALHKFEEVSRTGIDIQVASDALVQFVESETERELNLKEFTRVIILFALNNFRRDFEEVADHMLSVATSTSEAAFIRETCGADVTEIQAADKEEQEFLRETAKGIEEHVTDNIRKLRVRRISRPKASSPSVKQDI